MRKDILEGGRLFVLFCLYRNRGEKPGNKLRETDRKPYGKPQGTGAGEETSNETGESHDIGFIDSL